MALPEANSKIWEEIIKEVKTPAFEYLAVKIFLGTAKISYKDKPELLPELSKQLYELFNKNKDLPMIQNDLAKLTS